MVSVAKSFEAPIKLLFPRALDLAAAGAVAGKRPFSMLGLGGERISYLPRGQLI